MINNRKTIVSSIVAIAILGTTGAALAAAAVATTAVNVRSGPGTGYGIVDSLHAGETVDVEGCNGSWCKIQHIGPDGWVSGNYLAATGGGGGGAPAPAPEPDIPFNFGVTVGPGGPSFSFGLGDAPPPAPVPVAAKVCFYKNSNFGGANYCVQAGKVKGHLSAGWNNKISSIKLFGGAQVQVCKGVNYAAGCRTLTGSKAHLGTFNNKITSYQTW
ncbi:SH3 domain-containing protein [Devosia rhodophyticola]|uniref:SH3 domain-containing protein n=1 Tax=Devosia rhodophyticola TaxID=3026423 RepID=A0ABY7YV52_9HYPH|nr:SH3 domain-containing protein [Devosia rhodophyticola]WDR05131.1 SH3 domain-containing protein [Devosia rhodophyticola]